jgi:hypothetical protein
MPRSALVSSSDAVAQAVSHIADEASSRTT